MKRPLISIVTASYNALEGLKRTVDSVGPQTYPAIEHVIIDGGSDDGSVEYLKSLGTCVQWVSERDKGIGDALNKGIHMATGEYVLVLQAEDYFVASDSLERAASYLGQHDLVSFNVLLETSAGRQVVRSEVSGILSRLHMTIPHQGLFARRSLFSQIGNFDLTYRIAMDYDWLLRARGLGASAVSVPEAHTVMPATGISSRRDWPGMSARLDEFRRAQIAHATGVGELYARGLWWTFYKPFKRAKLAAIGR